MLDQVHIDILFCINLFFNPVDRFLLRGVCTRLRIYFQQESKPNTRILIQYGYLNLLIKKKLLNSNKKNCINWAAQYGQLEIIQYIYPRKRKNVLEYDRTCSWAAFGGHLKVLQYLRENGCSGVNQPSQGGSGRTPCPWDTEVCRLAARNGHLELLKWARENGAPWNELTCSNAAAYGHLEILKWARSRYISQTGWIKDPCPWDGSVCKFAAEGGHLNVLKWAREHGCPWDDLTCEYAVSNNHLEVFKWAHENGCPWDRNRCLDFAETFGYQHIIDWIRTV